MAEEVKTLYHYTSKENAEKIKREGIIQPSSNGAYGGDKVYMTSMSPSEGKADIARNNYDGYRTWEVREAKGHVDAAIKVEVPASKVTKEKDRYGRDIYTHKGPLKLDK